MLISFCRTLFYKIACKGTTFFAHMQILEIKKSKLIFLSMQELSLVVGPKLPKIIQKLFI